MFSLCEYIKSNQDKLIMATNTLKEPLIYLRSSRRDEINLLLVLCYLVILLVCGVI